MSTEQHDRCACGEDHAPNNPALDAFFSAVVDRIGRFPLDDFEARGTFIAGAIQGRVMREHVNEKHPDQVEHVAGIACPTNDTREGWLFGYRYEDPTPPRGGDDTDTAEHTGDARGGGGDAAGADRDGQGQGPLYGVDDLTLEHAKLCGQRRFQAGGDYLWHRQLPDGRVVALLPLAFGSVRLGVGHGAVEFDDVWDFAIDEGCLDAGWRAALGWDGEGEPEGWYRHPQSGRRRPGGDKAKEHVRP